MKQWIWLAARRIVFAAVLVGCVVRLGLFLQPRDIAETDWPTTVTFDNFYELEPNTVDVLFLGSSHGVCAFDPVELYNSYGLRSYNLCTAEQSLPISYFWLREALRTQQPKVVALETFFLFDYHGYYDAPLNTPKESVQRAIECMRFSANKMEAIRVICALDDSYDPLGYYFPIIHYHERWKYLNAESFRPGNEQGLMGYSPRFHNRTGDAVLEPFERLYDDKIEMQPVMKEYLTRIAEVCREHGIQLVLVKTPTTSHLLEKHNAIREFTDEYGVDFVDFNESEVFYNGLDYWFETDNDDAEHTNHWGALKVTNYLGDFFVSEYGLEAHEDHQWSDLNELYEERIAAGEEAAMNEE